MAHGLAGIGYVDQSMISDDKRAARCFELDVYSGRWHRYGEVRIYKQLNLSLYHNLLRNVQEV